MCDGKAAKSIIPIHVMLQILIIYTCLNIDKCHFKVFQSSRSDAVNVDVLNVHDASQGYHRCFLRKRLKICSRVAFA